MKHLATIDIGGLKWGIHELEYGDPLPTGMDHDDAGFCDSSSSQIYFWREKCPQKTKVLIVHEILHAAFDSTAAESMMNFMSKDRGQEWEEMLISALAPALSGLLLAIDVG